MREAVARRVCSKRSRSWTGVLAVGAVLAAVAIPTVCFAQLALHLPSTRDCTTCTIQVTRIATIGHANGVGPGPGSRVTWDSAGHYVVPVEPGPRIALYDSAGAFVRVVPEWTTTRPDRTARGIVPFVDPGGQLQVFDGSRVSWLLYLDSRDTSMSNPPIDYPGGFQELFGTPWGWLVTTAPSPRPHAAFVTSAPNQINGGSPPSKDGFAVDSVASSAACRDCSDVLVADALVFTKGSLFTASADRYQLEFYVGWGRQHNQTVIVDRPWFPSSGAAPRPGRALPEAPRLTGMRFDHHGCIRSTPAFRALPLAVRLACESYLWVSGLTIADSSAQSESVRYSTVIDVLGFGQSSGAELPGTLGSMRLVAELRVPGRLHLFGPALAYQHRQLAGGEWVIDVFRFTVKA